MTMATMATSMHTARNSDRLMDEGDGKRWGIASAGRKIESIIIVAPI